MAYIYTPHEVVKMESIDEAVDTLRKFILEDGRIMTMFEIWDGDTCLTSMI
jgi:hypothetical protein